ncbi:MAG: flagellar biosynthetic protein FliR [Gammaproteobacteria bacterium]|nr:flagellar biosynthetic protein FliR [Gammaproteobacteria bacterium]
MLAITSIELSGWIGSILWPFMRIGAMLMAAPIFGARLVPVRVRLALAMTLSWILSPMVYSDAMVINPLSAEGLMTGAQQILIGLAMGFTLQMVFSAVVIAAQSMAMGMGLGFATAVDPQNGVQVPVIAQYYLTLATLIFLAMNGHLLVIQMLVDSFRSLPVSLEGISREGLWALVSWGSRMFVGAILIALTAITSLLIINLAFGVMSRAAPQLNIFGVGFPVMMGAGFIVIMLSLPGLTPHMTELMQDAFELIGLLVAGG